MTYLESVISQQFRFSFANTSTSGRMSQGNGTEKGLDVNDIYYNTKDVRVYKRTRRKGIQRERGTTLHSTTILQNDQKPMEDLKVVAIAHHDSNGNDICTDNPPMKSKEDGKQKLVLYKRPHSITRKERLTMLHQRQKERIALRKIVPTSRELFKENTTLQQIGSNDSTTTRVYEQNKLSTDSDRMVEVWFEAELDALWVGVRRHGQCNWEAMINDRNLYFSKYKTAEALSERWRAERLRYINNIHLSQEPTNYSEKQKLSLGGLVPITKQKLKGCPNECEDDKKNEISSEGTISD